MKRYKLLGLNVDSISEEEVYNKIISLSEKESSSQIILMDTYLLMKAKFNKELFNIINSADLVLPISPGIKFGLGFFKHKIEKIYNFFYFTIRMLTFLTDEKKNIYILGGKKNNINKAEKNIRDSFPGIRLMGKYSIDYKKEFEEKLISAIQKVSPSLVLVSMKRPKQEKWIFQKKNKFKHAVFIGVERFVNILGGKELSPDDKLLNSKAYGINKLIKRPFSLFYYIAYLILLCIYKIFRLA
jgi:N-acetylglucosaminyldiphosphoundecaprenol N-acetyl-beta-D-mannosaminyltransferase